MHPLYTVLDFVKTPFKYTMHSGCTHSTPVSSPWSPSSRLPSFGHRLYFQMSTRIKMCSCPLLYQLPHPPDSTRTIWSPPRTQSCLPIRQRILHFDPEQSSLECGWNCITSTMCSMTQNPRTSSRAWQTLCRLHISRLQQVESSKPSQQINLQAQRLHLSLAELRPLLAPHSNTNRVVSN